MRVQAQRWHYQIHPERSLTASLHQPSIGLPSDEIFPIMDKTLLILETVSRSGAKTRLYLSHLSAFLYMPLNSVASIKDFLCRIKTRFFFVIAF
jgi:hypothetical protein